jgi:GT2 family glycosyltransferase
MAMATIGERRRDGADYPQVSIVVLGYNGREHLKRCLPSLLEQTYPADRLEILVVDNASTDGTADFVEAHFPRVRVVRNQSNLGFARGNNVGAQLARGEFVAFLNQDTRVQPTWVEELLAPILRDRRAGDGRLVCTGAKMVSWDGATIDFAGARMNFLGMASQEGAGQPDGPRFDVERPLLFPCGGAMLIDRSVFLGCGGFDEEYFVFFEDVDLGWRLWVLGYRVQLAPKAVTYHRVHASTGALHDAAKRLIYQRNALYSVLKNYDDQNLGRVLPATLLLTVQQVLAELRQAGARREDYDLRHRDRPLAAPVTVEPATISLLMALQDVIDNLPRVMAKRAAIQARRRRPDSEITPLFAGPLLPMAVGVDYPEANYRMIEHLQVADIFADQPRHVLLFSADLLPFPGMPTSGAGLRAWGIGKGLEGRGHRVTYSLHKVALAHGGGDLPDALHEVAWDEQTITDVVARVNPDIIVCCGWYPAIWLEVDRHPVVIDQHGPHMLERSFHRDVIVDFAAAAARKLTALAKADFFTCAGERQCHYFEPWLMQAGFDLTNPAEQPRVMPVSLSPALPEHRPEGELTFVYGGVFLPWQDPSAGLTTLVETLERHATGRLLVFGGGHPIFQEIGAGVFPQLRAALERSPRVTFQPFIAHAELLRHYARAHVAIDLMARNPERELAFTTRTVEYLWCGLPVIYNNYSELSDYIREYEAGWVLDPADRDGLVAVLEAILRDPELAAARGRNAQRLVRERLTWDRTIDPLDAFCRRPRLRAKRSPFVERVTGAAAAKPPAAPAPPPAPALPEAIAPVLERIAGQRRQPLGRAVARARRLAKQALRVDGPALHDGVLVQALPDLAGVRIHAQRFEAAEDGLCAIAVRFGTYGRLNTQEVTLRLRADGAPATDLAVVSVNASLLRDGAYHAFRFPPIAGSKGRAYVFSLESPRSVEGDAVTVWCELRAGSASEVRYQDGRPAPGRLAYRLEYAPVEPD